MAVTVYNRQKIISLPREIISLIKKGVRLCARQNGFTHPYDVWITLVDNDRIAQINEEHRNIQAPTDVLSFPLLDFSGGVLDIQPGDIDPHTKRVALGDIIISVEKAQEQADAYGHSFEREIAFLAVHGMLHLLGYDHEQPDEEKDMIQRQERVLQELNLPR
ncbi:rRNA maturation RNase YbeY [Thermoclostridium caenicola]|uniref:Endoribonuclease YbeY n=1 Tax=Thermoclostridium caenicola TaxID=659425 RepID=A0A1M6JVX3_9FIRM|nr:rRNA maturation RNase YbeY [Thermoclostridium caenicola]SHJ50851.1 probable rRNA maturation factor [Thermoclostridium caenicola]